MEVSKTFKKRAILADSPYISILEFDFYYRDLYSSSIFSALILI
jgi:hypothetical protein